MEESEQNIKLPRCPNGTRRNKKTKLCEPVTIKRTTDTKKNSPKSSPPKSSPRKSSPRKSSPRKSSPRKSSPRKSSPRKSSPQKSSPRKSSPQKSSPQKSSPPKSSSPKLEQCSKTKKCPLPRPTLNDVYDKVIEISETLYTLPKSANKGRPGNFLEELTGIPTSSACLDCLDGEVKVFPLKIIKKCEYVPKETIAITMLSKESLEKDSFEASRCFKKLEKTLYVPYLRINDKIIFMKPTIIDLTQAKYKLLLEILKEDYNNIRQYYLNTGSLDGSSKIGIYLQNRTKGAGRDAPKTRAYYLRPLFIKNFVPIELSKCVSDT
jgi:hypothetical protein